MSKLAEIRASGAGTEETSCYPALDTLLNAVGSQLKPKVRCILQLKNRGAGHPDGGLYIPEQFQKFTDEGPLPGQKPARGVIEVKPVGDDAWVTAESRQVSRYWKEYGQVLITNYRDFVLLGRDLEGSPVKLASRRLAPDRKAFWEAAEHPRKAASEQGERFIDFLRLALTSAAAISAPRDVASVLAYYAREARWRVEAQAELAALTAVREALEQALGLKFEGARGEHFFRSTLVQTLFYGVFSAWVLWSKQRPPTSREKFDWKLTQWLLRVPMIRVLFEQIATPGRLEPLGLMEVLDWASGALNRVARTDFFAAFEEQDAVQYFYEPFLEAFDPELRKGLGVWYTPLEVVKYMVARTDAVLREELGLEDGLADDNVYVLDPACGTGAYLVEVLRTITRTLEAKGGDGLAAHTVKRKAMERVFGFEILPAPFVISHLQLGLLLHNIGAPLAEGGSERVGVYLTNSLTGWEPPEGPKQHLVFPEMEAERDAADKVKREAEILVVIGNPPYNAFAGVSPAEEAGLVEPYKQGLISDWGIKKFNLDDLYVRFFRLAERRIAKTGRGIVSYISNFSYLSDPSFVVMRKRFSEQFDRLWFDCMNGDSRETGKLTPHGKPDPSVFSTESNREGIRLGTAICLMVRPTQARGGPVVRYRDFWGLTKRTDLLRSLESSDFRADYRLAAPSEANRFSFRPSVVAPAYETWPNPVELCADAPISGLQEMRREAFIDIDKESLHERIKAYYDPDVSWRELEALGTGLTRDAGGFQAEHARTKAQNAEKFRPECVRRYGLYPLDSRWCYWTPTAPLWNRPRPALVAQSWPANSFFIVRMFAERPHEHAPAIVTRLLPDYHLLRPNVVAIPFRVRHVVEDDGHHGRIKAREDAPTGEPVANLSERARQYLKRLGISDPDRDADVASVMWLHAVAVIYSPFYLRENGDGVRQDWPRVPLPASREALAASGCLGAELAALLNTEMPIKGVTAGSVRPELKAIGNITAVQAKTINPATDLQIDVGWGHPGKEGVTMPGKGKLIARDYTAGEREAIREGAARLNLTFEEALAQLGDRTCDVYLNDRACWKNIPLRVWEYTIGGYQVLKKWLSYREAKLLGRPMTPEEAHYVRDMARRIAAICLLQPQLDANYAAVKANTYAWPGG